MFDFQFDWNDDLLFAIPSVDSQHKEIFRIGREIEQLLTIRCIGVDPHELLNIVCELREFVGYHFYEEERLMKKYNYENLEKHKKEHEELKKMVMSIDLPRMAHEPFEELQQLKCHLQDGIFNHMMHSDKEMSAYIKNKMLGSKE